ncbi:hypothetical protein TruAng_007812 [Truncatella angustata]|nr:hypothetical protein TruAng_007812 [Truncatella angustata]
MTRKSGSQPGTRQSSSSASITTALTPSTESEKSYDFPHEESRTGHDSGSFAADRAGLHPSSTLTEGSQDAALADGIGKIHLSSAGGNFGVSELQSAIDDLASSTSTPRGSHRCETPDSSEHLSPPPRPTARRRSSPRTRQPPHVVEEEEPPQDRFHEPGLQKALSETKDRVIQLKAVLGSSELHVQPDSTVQRLYEKTSSLSDFSKPFERTVAFVGDSGVGKSSLLNSLLDFRALARTSNGGVACTCIATEYHYHDRDDFAIEVDIFSSDELDEMLQDMLQAFRHYEFYGDEMAGDEKVECEQRNRIAWYTFQSMFGNHLMNRSQMLTDDSEEAVLATLRSWAHENAAEIFEGRRVLASLAECSGCLVELTSDPATPTERAVWPFVKRLSVFLKAHVLSKGLIFADLPGLRDLNTARRNITERYILGCDEVFAIAAIGRAASDEGVKCVIDLAKRASLSNVGIVCTKSDDIKPNEALTDSKGKTAAHIRQLMDNVDSSEEQLKQVEEELRDYDEDDLSDEERDIARELSRDLARLSRETNNKKFELKRYIIQMRNRKVIFSLRQNYQHLVPDHGLKVFCVSNDDYWLTRNSPRDEAMPLLQLSGIISLRKHCISIVSEGQYQSAIKYIRHDVAALFSDIELWVRSGAPSLDAERKQEIREAVDVVERCLRNWHHGTYAAFCRNYGDHCTRAVGSRNWNEEATKTMVRDLTHPWQILMEKIHDGEQTFMASLEGTIQSMVHHLETNIQNSPELSDTLIDAMMSRQDLIRDELEKITEELASNLATLKTDVFSGIRTSFVGKAMELAYRGCNMESGTGSHSRRKAIVNRHISQEALFDGILRETTTHFRASVTRCETEVRRVLREQLGEFKATWDIVRNENAATEGEQDPGFRQRVESTLQVSQETMRGIESVPEIHEN